MINISPPSPPVRPSGKLYLSADQLNLVSGALTLVELDTIQANFIDAVEDVVNYRITPGVQGFYDVKAQVTFTSVIAGKRYRIRLKKNGATSLTDRAVHSNNAENLGVFVGTHEFFSSTDYIELYATSFAGVDTVDILMGVALTFLSIQRVR